MISRESSADEFGIWVGQTKELSQIARNIESPLGKQQPFSEIDLHTSLMMKNTQKMKCERLSLATQKAIGFYWYILPKEEGESVSLVQEKQSRQSAETMRITEIDNSDISGE